ncbi:unnamed protein product [Lepidochelys kempii]
MSPAAHPRLSLLLGAPLRGAGAGAARPAAVGGNGQSDTHKEHGEGRRSLSRRQLRSPVRPPEGRSGEGGQCPAPSGPAAARLPREGAVFPGLGASSPPLVRFHQKY